MFVDFLTKRVEPAMWPIVWSTWEKQFFGCWHKLFFFFLVPFYSVFFNLAFSYWMIWMTFATKLYDYYSHWPDVIVSDMISSHTVHLFCSIIGSWTHANMTKCLRLKVKSEQEVHPVNQCLNCVIRHGRCCWYVVSVVVNQVVSKHLVKCVGLCWASAER